MNAIHIHIEGSLGDEVAATGLPRELRRFNRGIKVWASGTRPELWLNNPHLDESAKGVNVRHISIGGNPDVGHFVHDYARQVGCLVCDIQPEIHLTPEESAAGKRWAGYVAVDPWAGWPRRRWPVQRFQKCVDWMLGRGLRVVEVGACVRDCFDEIRPERMLAGCESIVGKTDIRESASILSHCAVFLGNDSGLAHVAASVNCRSVVVKTLHWVRTTYPTTRPVFNLHERCNGCSERCIHHIQPCLDGISAEQVMLTVEQSLRDSPCK